MEAAGWARLLEQQAFRAELADVRVLVASHHGRENGYCKEVFDYARNVEVVIFSDSEMKYATQEMANAYANQPKE